MTHVLLLATHDVIAYPDGEPRVTSRRGATLLGDLPGGSVTAAILVEDVLAEPSWDTSVATMLALVRRARTALTHDGFTGVVVTHGLDTIEETALLTDLVLGEAARHGNVPVTLFSTIQELTQLGHPRRLARPHQRFLARGPDRHRRARRGHRRDRCPRPSGGQGPLRADGRPQHRRRQPVP